MRRSKQQHNRCSIYDLKHFLEMRHMYHNKYRAWFKSRSVCIVQMLCLRLLMVAICLFLLKFYLCVTQDYRMLFALIYVLVILAETFYLCYFNNGRDFYWFSISTTAFILFTLTLFWNTYQKRMPVRDQDPDCLNSTLTGPNKYNWCLNVTTHYFYKL